MRKRTVKLWRLTEDGRKLSAGTIEAADLASSSSNGRRSWPPPNEGSTSPPTAAASWAQNRHSRLRPAPWRPSPSGSRPRSEGTTLQTSHAD